MCISMYVYSFICIHVCICMYIYVYVYMCRKIHGQMHVPSYSCPPAKTPTAFDFLSILLLQYVECQNVSENPMCYNVSWRVYIYCCIYFLSIYSAYIFCDTVSENPMCYIVSWCIYVFCIYIYAIMQCIYIYVYIF